MRQYERGGFAWGLVRAAFLVFVVSVGLASSVPEPPGVLAAFLARNGKYDLLPQPRDSDALRLPLHQPSPLAFGDVTGDGLPDLLAVVVTRTSPSQFGVVAFHGTSGGFDSVEHWVVLPQAEKLFGVQLVGSRVVPAYCTACDAAGFLRWNGTQYEWYLWHVGDTPGALAADRSAVVLRTTPSQRGGRVTLLPRCSATTIVSVLPRDQRGTRWYRVNVTVFGRALVGFVRSTDLTENGCIG